jgi:hypothetical protein
VRDPITGRDISTQCWNGSHARIVHFEGYGESWSEKFGCAESDCGCLCHPRNQVEPVSVVPGFEDPCSYCLGLKEVAANCSTYIPCPKCCSAVSSEKEKV